jgi:hypothetical protein
MNASGIKPSLAAALRLLAQSQLQGQAIRSTALDTTAVGVIGVDAAFAALIASTKLFHQIWSVALASIAMSAVLALCALLVEGAERVGPIVADILDDRALHSDDVLEQWLVEDLATEMLVNQKVLVRKAPLVTGAFALLAMAIACELGGLVSWPL